jgi:hypothetical protein
MKTAYATIKCFEVMRMFKKGQFAAWIEAIGGGTEVSFVTGCPAFMRELTRSGLYATRPFFATEPLPPPLLRL